MPGCRGRTALRRAPPRRAGRPAPSAAGQLRAGNAAGGGAKFRASRPPSALAAPGDRAPGARKPASRLRPRACPGTRPGRGRRSRHSQQDFAEHHPGAPAAQRGLPQTIPRKKGGARETETCCRGQGSREEGTAVHAGDSASDQPGRRPPAARSAGRAEPALTWNPGRPASAPRSPAPARASSHFPAGGASRLRPRPAPERRPHSAAAGEGRRERGESRRRGRGGAGNRRGS